MSGKYHHRVVNITTLTRTKLYRETLQQIGLSKNEAKIYEALMILGPSNISSISSVGKVNRRNVYDSINNLLAENLVVVVREKTGNLYKAAEPKRLYEILHSQKNKISKVLPKLKNLYDAKSPSEQAYITRGVEGIKNFWNFVTSQQETTYFIGGKGAWHDEKLEEERKIYFKNCRRKGLEIKGLFDYSVFYEQKEVYSEYNPEFVRFIPKDFSTTASMDICADRLLMFPMGQKKNVQNSTIYNIISRPLADSYRKWFWYLWKCSISISKMK